MLSVISFPGLGIEIDPSPVAFNVFGKDIYWYGLIIAIGFIAAYCYMSARSKAFGLTTDHIIDLLLWVVPIGIVCARLYYCVFNWSVYRDNPISCLYIWEGGLAIYGGVLGGLFGIYLFSKISKIPFAVLGDMAAFGVIIGQIFGRWGNFMNREAHGGETTFILRMGLVGGDGVTRYYHPTFLYESLWNLVGLVLMHWLSKKRKFDGQMLLTYFLWYGLGRAWIEGMRTDSLYLFNTGIRVSQLLALLFVIFSIAMFWYVLKVKKPQTENLYINRVALVSQEAEAVEAAAVETELTMENEAAEENQKKTEET